MAKKRNFLLLKLGTPAKIAFFLVSPKPHSFSLLNGKKLDSQGEFSGHFSMI
jgi:hypothetical protein